MAFAPTFQRIFKPTFDRRNAGAGGTWWDLNGAIPAANVLIAYQPKGAASLAASYTNLANPGTYDATVGIAPTFDAATGWTFDGSTNYLDIAGGVGPILKPTTIIARITRQNMSAVCGIVTGQTGALEFGLDNTYKTRLVQENIALIGTANTATPIADLSIGASYSSAGAYAFYYNGAPDGSGTNNKTISADAERIGKQVTLYCYKGVISAIAIYNIVLTAPQIASLHTAIMAL